MKIRVLKNEKDYNKACKRLYDFDFAGGEHTDQEMEEMEVLAVLVQHYQNCPKKLDLHDSINSIRAYNFVRENPDTEGITKKSKTKKAKIDFILKEGIPAPEYAYGKASGFDVGAYSFKKFGGCLRENRGFTPEFFDKEGYVNIQPKEIMLFGTGITVANMRGYEIQVRPRSGLALDGLTAILGTVDEDYRGEINIILSSIGKTGFRINKGDKIAQLVPMKIKKPKITFNTASAISPTERGDKGFGSTGL